MCACVSICVYFFSVIEFNEPFSFIRIQITKDWPLFLLFFFFHIYCNRIDVSTYEKYLDISWYTQSSKKTHRKINSEREKRSAIQLYLNAKILWTKYIYFSNRKGGWKRKRNFYWEKAEPKQFSVFIGFGILNTTAFNTKIKSFHENG